MSFLEFINSNGYEVLVSLISANFIAQALKTIFYSIKHKNLNLPMLFSTGGMPSSHSSSVAAMSTSIGLIEGFDSMLFAVAFCVSSVVIYDSAGVRRSAGKQAEVLNQIIEELFADGHKLSGDKLKELLGHTPKEVFAGVILGIFISLGLREWIASSVFQAVL